MNKDYLTARPDIIVQKRLIASLQPFQGEQVGRHSQREAHPAQDALQGKGGRILPPLHGVPVPSRAFLDDQLQGVGRVP